MKRCISAGQHGVFFTNEEYSSLCSKILANNELIRQLKEELGLDEQTIQTDS